MEDVNGGQVGGTGGEGFVARPPPPVEGILKTVIKMQTQEVRITIRLLASLTVAETKMISWLM